MLTRFLCSTWNLKSLSNSENIYTLITNHRGVTIEYQNQDNECNCECNEDGEKIETCYFCLKKFDINKDDLSHYKFDKYPMCAYCSEFYGFYAD